VPDIVRQALNLLRSNRNEIAPITFQPITLCEIGRGGGVMTTVVFYVEQAKLLLLWAGTVADPTVKEQLRKRAQEYLLMADALEAGQFTAAQPAQPTTQQQQQIQPKKEGE
jgi:hypothetical protein